MSILQTIQEFISSFTNQATEAGDTIGSQVSESMPVQNIQEHITNVNEGLSGQVEDVTTQVGSAVEEISKNITK